MLDWSNHQNGMLMNDVTLNKQTDYNHTSDTLDSTQLTRDFLNSSENIGTCLKNYVTQSPLEVMAQRFGHVIREFQFNSNPAVNDQHENIKSFDHPSSFVNDSIYSSSCSALSQSCPYFPSNLISNYTPVPSNHLTQYVSPNTHKLPILLSKSSLDYFHSRLYETVGIPEKQSKIPSSNILNENEILKANEVTSDDSVDENLNHSSLVSTSVLTPLSLPLNINSQNSVQCSTSRKKQSFYYPVYTKTGSTNNLNKNQYDGVSECELQSSEDKITMDTNCCLNLSSGNNTFTNQDRMLLNFKDSSQYDAQYTNNLPIYHNKYSQYLNSLTNSKSHEFKCQYKPYCAPISNYSIQSYDYIKKSIDYSESPLSESSSLNRSLPVYCSTDCNNPNVKPPFSYITLIVSAMNSKLSKKITLNEIYAWIMSTFAYYRKNTRRWQNSIRHALSFNDCFIKVPRPTGESGKGSYWTIHPKAIDMFNNGSSMRRNRKFIDESRYRNHHNHQRNHQQHQFHSNSIKHNNNMNTIMRSKHLLSMNKINNNNSHSNKKNEERNHIKNQQNFQIGHKQGANNELTINKTEDNLNIFHQKMYHSSDNNNNNNNESNIDKVSYLEADELYNNNNNSSDIRKLDNTQNATTMMNTVDTANYNMLNSWNVLSSLSVGFNRLDDCLLNIYNNTNTIDNQHYYTCHKIKSNGNENENFRNSDNHNHQYETTFISSLSSSSSSSHVLRPSTSSSPYKLHQQYDDQSTSLSNYYKMIPTNSQVDCNQSILLNHSYQKLGMNPIQHFLNNATNSHWINTDDNNSSSSNNNSNNEKAMINDDGELNSLSRNINEQYTETNLNQIFYEYDD
ncbi:unnamed protein product [Trichobilharzia szidati]|nr:unnamed protein product [Trichobilharzia szidati]